MTDTSKPTQNKPPLGFGQIVSESFSLLFGNIVAIAVAAIVPSILMIVLSGMTIGFGLTFGIETVDPAALPQNLVWATVVNSVISLVVYGIISALIVQIAYDAKLGKGTNFKKYFSAAIQTIVPNVVLTLVVSILAALAMIALILPGIWVYGVFSVIIPVIVVERAGFGALGRSAELTKEYRWPIIGTMIVVIIAAVLLQMVLMAVIGALIGLLGLVSIIIATVLMAIGYTLIYGLVGIAISLIYSRLREIKEGVGVEDLSAVFE